MEGKPKNFVYVRGTTFTFSIKLKDPNDVYILWAGYTFHFITYTDDTLATVKYDFTSNWSLSDTETATLLVTDEATATHDAGMYPYRFNVEDAVGVILPYTEGVVTVR